MQLEHAYAPSPDPGNTLPGYWGIKERSIWNVMRQGGTWDDEKMNTEDYSQKILKK